MDMAQRIAEDYARTGNKTQTARNLGVHFETVRYHLDPAWQERKKEYLRRRHRKLAEQNKRTPEQELAREMKKIKCASPTLRVLFTEMTNRGIDCATFGEMIGVSDSSTRNWRSGRTTPSVMEVEAMAHAFGWTVALVPG